MKVLVVDDEPAVREVIARALRSVGNEVVTAAGADEAVARFMEGGVDVITLDQRMPGVQGSELHKLLSEEFGAGRRVTEFTPRRLPPVLIITAVPGDRKVILATFGESVVGVLPKPFDVDRLLQTVAEAATRRGAGPPSGRAGRENVRALGPLQA